MGTGRIKLSEAEVSAFCEQLGYMVRAGISLEEGLLLLQEEEKSFVGRRILAMLSESVARGETLGAAVAATGAFPAYMARMVAVGEAAGRLEEVLGSLRDYYERQAELAKNIRSALTYPLVMIAMMAAVILVIVVRVLPVFAEVFRRLGSDVSGFVQGLIDFGAAVNDSAAVLVGVLAALLIASFILRASPRGGAWGRALAQRLFPATSRAVYAGRFAAAMALMLGSGMNVEEALGMAAGVMDQGPLRERATALQRAMEQGGSFAEAVIATGLYPGLYGRMIAVGFRTGTLETVMRRIAAHYGQEADRRIQAAISALEPTLVAALCLIVGLVLLSVMLPLIGVMSAIG